MPAGFRDLFGLTARWLSSAQSNPPEPGAAPIIDAIIKSGYNPKQLTLAIFRVSFNPFSEAEIYRGNFQAAVSSWEFEISANGGYKSARFTLLDNKRNVRDWFENSLACRVVCYSPSHDILWEGFINKVSINFGSLSADRGPLMDIANRVSLMYTPLDITVFPPVSGITRPTTIADNTDSQAKYGIIERVLSGGNIPDEDAEQIRDTYLAENALPVSSNAQLVLGSGGQPAAISIECLGYVEYLRAYVYNQTTSSSSITITSKIETILKADPNGIFSTNYSQIETNNYLTYSYEEDNKDALSILNGMLAIGDINDSRYLMGVYAGRVVKYNAVPTAIEYQQTLTDNRQTIKTIDGKNLHPWHVLPGKYILLTDFVSGKALTSAQMGDPRLVFIESIRFTAPYSIQISGGRTDKLPQKLAKWGLGGI